MDYKVYTKSIDLTEALEDYISKRMTKPDRLLQKHNDLVSSTEFRVDKEGGIYKTEITSHFKVFNKIVKVEEKSGDLYEAIDDVTDAFERKIRKVKSKLQDHVKENHKALQKAKLHEYSFEPNQEDEYEDVPLVKEKRYDLTIMSTDEAILQTDMIGHNFFVYRNSETDEVNVIYKRNDNKYGLIEFNS